MSMAQVEIRPITKVSETDQLEDVQRETWRMPDIEVLPSRFLHAMQFNGSPLIGAFVGERVVGYVFGTLGTVQGLEARIDQIAAARLQLYSVMMGVLPDYQGLGIGYRLKLAQREFALRVGVRLVTWTFDPLESRNGYFNIAKLGVVCHRYLRDFHGRMGGINRGLPTDRLHAEWWVTNNRVEARVVRNRGSLNLHAFVGGGARLVNDVTIGSHGLPTPQPPFEQSNSRIIMVEIPADIQAIKQANMDLAQSWRAHTREIFEHYFERGYVVTDFVRHQEDDGRQRSLYVLTHMEA
ncbi:MAG: hypothetical protein R3300_21795 [Candidatus Promineifilaceae bacterium]|nr:hypothetical protein [Candidatus Promineifilaceae bacterium]